MILQTLVHLYGILADQGKVEREGWCRAKVSYAIQLSKEGGVLGILCLKTEERGKKKVWIPQQMTVPEMVIRSSGISANFLCDNSKYMLGIDAAGTNPRVRDCFGAARKKHVSLLQETGGEMAQAIRRFFETWNPDRAMECVPVQENWENITDGGNLIFCMGMKYAQDDQQVQEAWERGRKEAPGEETEGICLVTGKKASIARIHRTIKGVPGAQSSGAALVSFNAPAFESYGKEQSYNAPVGKYAEFAYTTALNYLLSQQDYTFSLGDSTILFWAENAAEEYQMAFLESVEPPKDNREEIRGIFENLKKGQPVQIRDMVLDLEQNFYILALAPNAARLSVRFFYQNTFGAILQNLTDHYERMSIIKPAWEKREYLGIGGMLWETVNQKAKQKTPVPNMAAMVLQGILSGAWYPASLYTDTLIRIRAEQGKVTWGRAGIIKAYLIQNANWKEGEHYTGLNESSQETAYVLGRLFSVLESIQMDANPEINTTIRNRYFNAACANPASVFPVLVKLKNSHIKKLERGKVGTKIYYEKLLAELMERLIEYPKHLPLEEQGKFILGYYHQMQKRYEKREG